MHWLRDDELPALYRAWLVLTRIAGGDREHAARLLAREAPPRPERPYAAPSHPHPAAPFPATLAALAERCRLEAAAVQLSAPRRPAAAGDDDDLSWLGGDEEGSPRSRGMRSPAAQGGSVACPFCGKRTQ
jgi:hypothetical protein